MLTEKDIDALIASVSREIDNADSLAKSEEGKGKKAKKAELKKDEAPLEDNQDDAAQAAAEAPAEAPAEEPAAEAPAAEAPAPDQEMSAEAPAEEPMAEGQDQGQVSDEDLMEIYSSMPPEELERHVMIAQQVLARAKGEGAQPEAPAPAQAPQAAPAAPEAMAMSEKDKSDKLAKAEKEAEIDSQKKQIDELKKSVSLLTQAVEAGFKPVRKSVQGVEFIQRGPDTDESEKKTFSKAEMTAKLTEIAKRPGLSKSERTAIDQYCLYGTGREAVEKLVTGGK